LQFTRRASNVQSVRARNASLQQSNLQPHCKTNSADTNFFRAKFVHPGGTDDLAARWRANHLRRVQSQQLEELQLSPRQQHVLSQFNRWRVNGYSVTTLLGRSSNEFGFVQIFKQYNKQYVMLEGAAWKKAGDVANANTQAKQLSRDFVFVHSLFGLSVQMEPFFRLFTSSSSASPAFQYEVYSLLNTMLRTEKQFLIMCKEFTATTSCAAVFSLLAASPTAHRRQHWFIRRARQKLDFRSRSFHGSGSRSLFTFTASWQLAKAWSPPM